ncbi:MAG: glycosyltransferase family 2 protein [bacterium]|nr:glycosyltransferase family 2 protein [bacterium]
MVSIIILSYNTKSLLRECLTAIFSTLRSFSFEVIVFDNASKDDSVHMVKTEFPRVIVKTSDENLGFAKGINLASCSAKGEYLLFLNSDAVLLDNKLKEMIVKLEVDKKIAVIGGNLLSDDNTTSAPYGSFYNLAEVFRLLFYGKKSRPALKQDFSSVDWVSGGYMLIRNEVFVKSGGFDVGFFMYIEDMELCYRLKKDGYSVYYFMDARARHVGQGSSNRTFAIVNIYRGLLFFYKKHKARWQFFVVQLLLFTKAIVGIFGGIVTGNKYLRETYFQALKVVV